MATAPAQTTAMRAASWISAINVLVAAGFSLAGLISPKAILPVDYAPTEASFLFAVYAAARAIPLALVTLAAIYRRSASALLVLASLAGIIQLADSSVGLLEHDVGKTLGPLAIAAAQFWAVFALWKSTQKSASIV